MLSPEELKESPLFQNINSGVEFGNLFCVRRKRRNLFL